MRQPSRALRAFLASAVAFLTLSASPLRAEDQHPSLKKVRQQFPSKKGMPYIRALRKHANKTELSLYERQKSLKIAAAQLRKLNPARPRLAARISVSQAELEGLRMRWSRRRSFLRQAEKFMLRAKRKQGARDMAQLRKQERLLPKLARAAQKLGTQKRKLRSSEKSLLQATDDLLKLESRLRQQSMLLQIKCWQIPLLLIDSENALQDPAGLLADLDKTLTQKPRLAASRQKLLRWAARYFVSQQNWHQAAIWAVKADRIQVAKAGLPLWNLPARGDYCRSKASHKICLQAQQNQASCLDVEKQLFKNTCFFDFSRMAEQRAFNAQTADEVLQTYSPLLRSCLIRAAQAGELLPGAKVELSWTPRHNGRVGDVEIRPHRYLGGAYEKCVRASFARFRYPPCRGELQHIALQFRVND